VRNSVANPDSDSDSNSYGNRDRNGDVYTNTDCNGYIYSNADGHSHIHANSYSYRNVHAYTHSYCYRNCYTNSHSYSHANSGANTCGSDSAERNQCDCQQLYRELEQCKWRDRLPVGCGYGHFFCQLCAWVPKFGRRQHNESKRERTGRQYVLLLPVTRLQWQRHGPQFQRHQSKDQAPLSSCSHFSAWSHGFWLALAWSFLEFPTRM
jgi:hypothetical protein